MIIRFIVLCFILVVTCGPASTQSRAQYWAQNWAQSSVQTSSLDRQSKLHTSTASTNSAHSPIPQASPLQTLIPLTPLPSVGQNHQAIQLSQADPISQAGQISQGAQNTQEEPAPYLFTGTFFPLILERGAAGKPRGLSVDILKRISEITGDRIEVKIYPWTRALQMARTGAADGLIGPYFTVEREAFLSFSKTHFYEDRMVLLKRYNSAISWQGDFASLSRYTMLAINGWAYGPEFDAALSYLNVEKVATPEQALNMLCKERADLVVLNERSALYEMRREDIQGELSIMQPAFRTVLGYFAFSREKEDKAFESRFNAALAQLASSGEIKDLSANYDLTYIGPAVLPPHHQEAQ